MKTYRRLLALVLVYFVLAAAMAGCAKQPDSDASAATNSASQPADNANSAASDTQPAADGDAVFTGEATVYFMYPDSATPRWESFDGPIIEKNLKKLAPNVELKWVDAQGDSQKQLQQVEAAISSGCDFMILIPAQEEQAAGTVNLLNDEGIPFACMCHTPYGANCPIFITMPFADIAESYVAYAEENILNNESGYPYKIAYIPGPDSNFYTQLTNVYHAAFEKWAAEGKAEVIFEAQTDNWSAADAQKVCEQMLTQAGNDVDIIITNNDDLNAGCIAALNDQGLIGQVHVLGGCDVTKQGLAHVQEGWQEGDIMPDYETMGATMATICATYLATGEYPMDLASSTTDNHFMDGGIPTVNVPALLITRDNMKQLVVDTGVVSQADIDAIANTLK